MKRSGQPKPFRTIGTRMRDFGRSMMRHYVPPQDMPPLVEPPPPAWGAAAQTPLIWPEPDAPAGFAAETPLAPLDAGFDDAPDVAQDFAQSRRAPRPAPPQPPPAASPVQRRPAPPANSVDQRLKNILAMHQEREVERQHIRDEKKTAFNAAEIQRQADPDAPHRPRRGRMSVDYVETSALSHGEEAPPSQSVQPAAPDEPPQTSDDTARLDPSLIQASLDEMNVQREPAVPVDDFDDVYVPAGDEDNPQAYFESPPDWSEDSGDEGTPPPIDVPPTPMPPQGSVQRMPDAPDTGDFSEQSERGEAENWGATTEYPYESDSGDDEAPPASDTITLSPDYAPDEPDFGGAADFEPTYNDATDAEFLNPPTTVQRDYQAPAPDFSAETGDFEVSDAGYSDLPTSDLDDDDTRPMDVQHAPVLPPPDFVDDSIDAPPAETGYNSLADWVDAQSDAAPTSDSAISAQPPGRAERVQRDYESPTLPIAPDFSLQTGDFNQTDFARDASLYFDEDEDDTRRMDVQRSFQESDFAAEADYLPAYPVEDDAAYADYSEQAAPDVEAEWSGDVYTPPVADVPNMIQRDYESQTAPTMPAEAGYDAQVEQGYIEPADARSLFEEMGSSEQTEWGGAVSTPIDSGNSVQRDADAGEYEAAESEAEWSADADVYTPPADTVQRDDEMPAEHAYDAPRQNEMIDDETSAPEGQWGADADVYTPPADTVQRDYQQPTADDYDAAQEQLSGDVDAETPNTLQRDYESKTTQTAPTMPADGEAYEDDNENIAPEWGWDASPPADQPPYDNQPPVNPWGGDVSAPSDAVQRDYQPPDLPDDNTDMGDQPVDLYQAMMGAGMVAPDADAGWDGGDVGMSPGFVQRTPDADANAHAPSQPVDVFQAMMQTGMVQPLADDNMADTYYPPDTDTALSAATRADLLSLLDAPAPRAKQASTSEFTPDADVSQPTVSRSFQPPPQTNPPPIIQRAATEHEPEDGQQNDVNVDQLARDVYSTLRNRLRIERERRDRKP